MLESSLSKLKKKKKGEIVDFFSTRNQIRIDQSFYASNVLWFDGKSAKSRIKKKKKLEARANSISNWIAHQTIAKSNLCAVCRQCWIENHLGDRIIVRKPEKRIVSMRKVFTINALIRLFSVHSFIDFSALCFFSSSFSHSLLFFIFFCLSLTTKHFSCAPFTCATCTRCLR